VLARLQDLAGQTDAARRLTTAISKDRLHHAMLFAGPDGVGKFTAALGVAQLSFCTSARAKQDGASCALCKSCNKFLADSHPDVVIPPANDKGNLVIDSIRSAIESLHIRPLEAPFKYLIVRDAERMNINTQNAFLKTLEEPPGGAKLILTTSRPETLIGTIISRCQRVTFPPVAPEAIQALLRERKEMNDGHAALVAALAQGSPSKAFDTDPDALIAERDWVADVDLSIEPGSPRAIGRAFEAAADMSEGKDAKEKVRRRMDLLRVWLRDQILIASGARSVDLANLDRADELADLAHRRGLTAVLDRARALDHAQAQLDLPYNLKAALIVEQLFIAFAGHGGRV